MSIFSKFGAKNQPLAPELEDAKIVPSTTEGTFMEVWSELAEVPHLYTAASIAEDGRGVKLKGEVNMSLDYTYVSFQNGSLRASCVYTDKKMLKPATHYGEFQTAEALRYCFNSPRVNAVVFNFSSCSPEGSVPGKPDYTYELPQHVVAVRPLLPRLIGLVESDDPIGKSGLTHSELAQKAAKKDDIFVAYYHAEVAREFGENLNDYFFTLVDTLISLAMIQEAADYVNWYQQSGFNDPRIKLYFARLYSRTGQPQTSFQIIDEFLDHPSLASVAWLEHGRALIGTGDYQGAIDSFEKSLALNPNELDTLLGHGIALRNLHYPSSDREGLMKAKESFERVTSVNGYHTPEALHHLGTISVALEEWAEAEDYCKKTLELKDNPVSRRNLVLSLHAQSRLDEAQREFNMLRMSYPDEAEKIAHYFSGPATA